MTIPLPSFRMLCYAVASWVLGFSTLVEPAQVPFFASYPDEFYYLTIQRCHSTAEWSIHGLWPNFGNGSWPEYCVPDVDYDPTQITPDTLDDMYAEWYSCGGMSDQQFWDHEVAKHYTCVFNDTWTQEDYFSNGIELYWASLRSPTMREYCGGEECMIPWSIDLQTILW